LGKSRRRGEEEKGDGQGREERGKRREE